MQKTSESPLASIIVLFLGGSPWIDGCLESLRRNVPRSISHEVIVLANGIPADADMPVRTGDGVMFLRSEVNLGFGGGCNWAARHARGRYLVLLNDDAAVAAGWLEALLSAAESDAQVAAAGSLVLTPDGRIEEAGRVLWRDGVSHGIAQGRKPDAVTPAQPREVDSCSGCSLLVRRSAWEAVGGFDERYYPAYYEDADLCLKLRAKGWGVLCAPGSQVRHQRSASTTMLWRRFLGLRNHRLFVQRWEQELGCFEPRPRDSPTVQEIDRAAEGAGKRRKAVYDIAAMSSGPEGTVSHVDAEPETRDERSVGRIALMEQEVVHLRAQLHVKEEYIAFLQESAPEMERGLQRDLEDEARRARRRERIRRVPVLGPAAVWVNRKLRATQSSHS
jgi:GT2 family glycosyltransferase